MAVHGQEPGELDGCHPEGRLARWHVGGRPGVGGEEFVPSCSQSAALPSPRAQKPMSQMP